MRPLEEQEDRESQKLWQSTIVAIIDRNHDVATDEKTKVEDMQREEAAKRAELGVEWHPRLFRKVRGGPGGSEEGEEDLDWILNAEMFAIRLRCPYASPSVMLTSVATALPLTLNRSRYEP